MLPVCIDLYSAPQPCRPPAPQCSAVRGKGTSGRSQGRKQHAFWKGGVKCKNGMSLPTWVSQAEFTFSGRHIGASSARLPIRSARPELACSLRRCTQARRRRFALKLLYEPGCSAGTLGKKHGATTAIHGRCRRRRPANSRQPHTRSSRAKGRRSSSCLAARSEGASTAMHSVWCETWVDYGFTEHRRFTGIYGPLWLQAGRTVRTSPPACQQHRSVGAAMVWVSRLCSCQVLCSPAVVAAPPRRCQRRWLAPRPQRRARRAPARQPAASQSPARTGMCIAAALHTYPRSLQCAQGPDRRFRAVAKRCV